MADVYGQFFGLRNETHAFGYGNCLKRRRFIENENPDVNSQFKRSKFENSESDHLSDENGLPSVNFMAQGSAQHEIHNLRAEFSNAVAERDFQITALQEENRSLQDILAQAQGEMSRILEECKILKRAVQVQNTKSKEAEKIISTQQEALVQAADHIKKLEQANYSLRVHLEARGNCGNFFPFEQPPPDVF